MARINPEGERRGPARSFLGALNTYVKPERDVSGAQALQEGLGMLSSSLGKWQAKAQKEQNEADYQKGKADYLRKAAGQEPEGIKRGTLFRSQSKFYAMGLSEAQGEAKAIDWSNGLTTAYKQWDGRGSSNPDAFRSWMNQQSAAFLQTLGEDDHALAAAMPYINRANQSMAKHHVAYRDEQMKIARFNAFDTKVASVFDDYQTGAYDNQPTDTYDRNMARRLEREVNLMIGSGENGSSVISKIVQAAVHHSNAYDDPRVLRDLARLHDKGLFKLSKANQAALADANDAVENDILRRQRIDDAAAADAADKAEKAIVKDYMLMLEQDPYYPVPSASEIGADAYSTLTKLQDAHIKAFERVSPTDEVQNAVILDGIMNDPDLSTSDKLSKVMDVALERPVKDIGSVVKSILAEDDPDAIQGSATFKERRAAFLGSINTGVGISIMGQDAALTAAVRINYNNYVQRFGGAVDKNDADAIFSLTQKAEEYALKQAYMIDPTAFDQVTNPLIRATLGLEAVAQTVKDEKAEAARIQAEKDAAAFAATLPTGDETIDANVDPEPEAEPQPEPTRVTVTEGADLKSRGASEDNSIKPQSEAAEIDSKMIAQARGIIKGIPHTRGFGASVTKALKKAFPNLSNDQILELVTRSGTETK